MKSLSILYLLFLVSAPINASDALSFTKTQTIGLEEKSFSQKYQPVFKLSKFDSLVIPAPKNDSSQTLGELKALQNLQKDRTIEDINLIKRQKKFCRFDFPDYRVGFNAELDQFILQSFLDVSYYIFYHKIKNNRVRPSFLSEKIKPAIDIPPHPAYPSAHAGQSLIVALILSDIKPELKESYLKLADNIGRNRELAGVHYKSDTDAGQKIAQIYYSKIKNTPVYKAVIRKVKNVGLKHDDNYQDKNCEMILSAALKKYR